MPLAGQIALIPDGRKPFQRIVQRVTGSPFHHCVVAVSDKWCVSAEMPRVRLRPISHFPNAVWSDFRHTRARRRDISRFAFAQIGAHYALLDDLLIGVAILTKQSTPHWLAGLLMDNGRWQCAELADASLLAGGVNLFTDGRPPCAVYPGSFVPYFQKQGWLPVAVAD